jgi:hypothetical protein
MMEGTYHYGLAALANSLYAHGYRGDLFVGYRGELPPWVTRATQTKDEAVFEPAEEFRLRFLPLTTSIHLTNYKPEFMMDLWSERCRDAQRLFYFDPDIVVLCRWRFFEEWVEAGVALCQDVNGSMPDNHPIRHAWRQLAKSRALCLPNRWEMYFNGGFVGLRQETRTFLDDWAVAIDLVESEGTKLTELNTGDRASAFSTPDQDALNIASMATKATISPVGQDGMDFQWGGGGYVMSHAIGPVKPWSHCFTFAALRGRRIGRPTRQFLNYINGPIQPYSSGKIAAKRVDCVVARVIGRIVA